MAFQFYALMDRVTRFVLIFLQSAYDFFFEHSLTRYNDVVRWVCGITVLLGISDAYYVTMETDDRP